MRKHKPAEIKQLFEWLRHKFSTIQMTPPATMSRLENIVMKCSRLSKPAIIRHIGLGNIVIEPFKEKNIGSAQYDVSLGEYFYRENANNTGIEATIYNPYDEEDVRKTWTLCEAITAEEIAKMYGLKTTKDYFGETILGHTEEFIGGRNCVTTEMRARSSIGRNFIAVCKCAGCGDIGYINRWTMEITNFSQYHKIPLVVGRRIAQILFYETEQLEQKDDYTESGKYQTSSSIEELKKSWKPEDMLPKMWKDREIKEEKEKYTNP